MPRKENYHVNPFGDPMLTARQCRIFHVAADRWLAERKQPTGGFRNNIRRDYILGEAKREAGS